MDKWKNINFFPLFLLFHLIIILEVVLCISNLNPLHSFDLRQQSANAFEGQNNETFPDYFNFLFRENGQIYLGGRNRLYNLSVDPEGNIVEHEGLRWDVSEGQKRICLSEYYSRGDCHNYVRLMGRLSPHKIMVCGTHAFDPKCRSYRTDNPKKNGGALSHNPSLGDYEFEEKSGMGYTAFHQYQNTTATIVNGQIFAGTFVDVWSGEPIVYREPVRTPHSTPTSLNAPQFVASFAFGRRFVYFLLRERKIPSQYVTSAHVTPDSHVITTSRVARVCVDDSGYRDPVYDRPLLWKTFLKAGITCPVSTGEDAGLLHEIRGEGSGAGVLILDQLIAAAAPPNSVGGEGGPGGGGRFYALFTLPAPPGTVPVSALCQFDSLELEKAFSSGIKRRDSKRTHKADEPAIGDCDYDYTIDPEDAYHIQNSPLIPDLTLAGTPLAVWSGRMPTVITVDYGLTYSDTRSPGDVIYLGTDRGAILKLAVRMGSPAGLPSKVEVLEKLEVLNTRTMPAGQSAITGLEIVRNYAGSGESAHLMVIWPGQVLAVPLARCHLFQICTTCRLDPHCAWDGRRCTPNTSVHHSYTGAYHQLPCSPDGFKDSDLRRIAAGQEGEDAYGLQFLGDHHAVQDESRHQVSSNRVRALDADGQALIGERRSFPDIPSDMTGRTGPVISGPTTNSKCSADRLGLAIVATAFATSLISCFLGFRLRAWLDKKTPHSSAPLSGGGCGLGNGSALLHHHAPAYFVMNKVHAPPPPSTLNHQSIYEPPPLPPLHPPQRYLASPKSQPASLRQPGSPLNRPAVVIVSSGPDTDPRKVYI